MRRFYALTYSNTVVYIGDFTCPRDAELAAPEGTTTVLDGADLYDIIRSAKDAMVQSRPQVAA